MPAFYDDRQMQGKRKQYKTRNMDRWKERVDKVKGRKGVAGYWRRKGNKKRKQINPWE